MSKKNKKELNKLYDEISYLVDSISKSESNEKIQSKTENLALLLNSVDIELELSTFVGLVKADMKLSADDIKHIRLLLVAANMVYTYTSESTGLTDTEYDLLVEKINSLEKKEFNPSLTLHVTSTDKTTQHTLPSLRGTLDKVYFLESFEEKDSVNKSRKGLPDWLGRCDRKLRGTSYNIDKELIYVFPKFDGVSVIFEFDKDDNLINALTRGDVESNEAQNLNHIFGDYFGEPSATGIIHHGIKTECMMSEQNFQKYCSRHPEKKYEQSRSAVSSIINSLEPDKEDLKLLTLFYLRESSLNSEGEEKWQRLHPRAFDVPYIRCTLEDIDLIREFASNNKYVDYRGELYRTDGLVIYVINEDVQRLLGRKNHKMQFEVAYKFTEDYTYSKLRAVRFTVGPLGKVTPIAMFEPVDMKGNTIIKASLGSIGRFKSLKLREGDTIKVLYDIIPYVTIDNNCPRGEGKKYKAPKHCPDCGEDLYKMEDSEELFCKNKMCPCRQKGKILNYTKKMGIEGISFSTVDLLYSEGYLKSIQDIYRLENKKALIAQLPGYGYKKVNNIIKSINAHRSKKLSPAQVLGSIGIENISIKTFEKVFQMYDFEQALKWASNRDVDAFAALPGVSEKTAVKIISGINENITLIKFLRKILDISDHVGSYGGFSVAFSKIRDKDLERYIENLGGTIDDSVTKDTNLLVIPDLRAESGKTAKALKYNIPIVDIDNARTYISTNFK